MPMVPTDRVEAVRQRILDLERFLTDEGCEDTGAMAVARERAKVIPRLVAEAMGMPAGD